MTRARPLGPQEILRLQALARRISAVIAWPDKVEDQQAACYSYSSHLYRHIVSGRRVDAAVADAGHMVSTQWPELAPPKLFGKRRDPVV